MVVIGNGKIYYTDNPPDLGYEVVGCTIKVNHYHLSMALVLVVAFAFDPNTNQADENKKLAGVRVLRNQFHADLKEAIAAMEMAFAVANFYGEKFNDYLCDKK